MAFCARERAGGERNEWHGPALTGRGCALQHRTECRRAEIAERALPQKGHRWKTTILMADGKTAPHRHTIRHPRARKRRRGGVAALQAERVHACMRAVARRQRCAESGGAWRPGGVELDRFRSARAANHMGRASRPMFSGVLTLMPPPPRPPPTPHAAICGQKITRTKEHYYYY